MTGESDEGSSTGAVTEAGEQEADRPWEELPCAEPVLLKLSKVIGTALLPAPELKEDARSPATLLGHCGASVVAAAPITGSIADTNSLGCSCTLSVAEPVRFLLCGVGVGGPVVVVLPGGGGGGGSGTGVGGPDRDVSRGDI